LHIIHTFLFQKVQSKTASKLSKRCEFHHWINVNEVNAGVGWFFELFKIVAAVNDAGVE